MTFGPRSGSGRRHGRRDCRCGLEIFQRNSLP